VGTQNIRTATRAFWRSILILLASVTLAGGLLSAGAAQPSYAARQPLRQLDWLTVLKNDPAVTFDPDAFHMPGSNAPYVSVPARQGPEGTLGGYALIDDVIFADLDGDGAEEAIVLIDSGGTGGLLGFLLYREADPAPKLVLARSGYKIGVTIEGNRVGISEPNYVGFEPNCCPSAVTRTSTTLQGDQLVPVTTEVEPNDVQDVTVWAFYQAVTERRYEDAYDFYSPAFQSSNPFAQWKAGYANTQSIEVETSAGRTPSEVQIMLTSTDTRPGGGTVTRTFKGTWTLIWSGERQRWLLDKASIQAA
jgi:hypothetical protein